MGKVIALLFTACFSLHSFAQSFDFYSRNFDVKLDMADYYTTIQDNRVDSLQNDTGIAAVILSPQMAWAIGEKVSLGGSLSFGHYFDPYGAVTKSQLNGLDASVILDVHFLAAPKADMMVGLRLGVAGIRLDANDRTGDIYGSLGGAADIHVMGRFYVSNHLAILASVGFSGYEFQQFGKNLNATSTIDLLGFSFGSGIALRLPNQKTGGSQSRR